MALTGKQRRHLRALAHHLRPVVITGASGLTEAVLLKIHTELENHELIKVKVAEGSTGEAAEQLASGTDSEVAQVIGKTVVLYRRRRKDPEIKLPQA